MYVTVFEVVQDTMSMLPKSERGQNTEKLEQPR